MNITQKPADPGNYMQGRNGHKPELILIHVMDGTEAGTAAWFANPAANVSAHYGVSTKGEIEQYVSENDTAFHAGNWDVNLRSIGVEHEGQPRLGPWVPSADQLRASAAHVAGLCRAWGIVPSRKTIIPHSDINPKHHCPGDTWPWDAYMAQVAGNMPAQNAHQPVDNGIVRLFDPVTNKQTGLGTIIPGTDKVYIRPPEKP